MTFDEAFALIEKLDFPEGLRRKFAPSYSLLCINRDGEIAAFRRSKSAPTEEEQYSLLQEHPHCMMITALPGMYPSADALERRVREDLPLFDRLKLVDGFESLGSSDRPSDNQES